MALRKLWHEPSIARKAKLGPDSSQVAGDSIVPARPGRRVFTEDILWVQHVLHDESIRATGRAERSGATSRSRTKVGCRQKTMNLWIRKVEFHEAVTSKVWDSRSSSLRGSRAQSAIKTPEILSPTLCPLVPRGAREKMVSCFVAGMGLRE